MAYRAFGGEMGFFVPADANTIENATSGFYDSTFSRCATRVGEGVTFARTPDIGSTLTDAWLHFMMHQDRTAASGGAADDPILYWADDAGADRLRLTWNWTTFDTKLWYDIGLGWTQAGSTFQIDFATIQTLDLHVLCDSASGTITLYTSGTDRIDISVDTSVINQLNEARFLAFSDNSAQVMFASVSEVIIADETTIGKRLMGLYTVADGTFTDMTGAEADVDEIPYNDADGLASAAADEVSTFTIAPQSAIGSSYYIDAIGVAIRGSKGATGPTGVQAVLVVGGNDYYSATMPLDFGMGAHVAIWTTNPDTASLPWAWTLPDEIGVKSIA